MMKKNLAYQMKLRIIGEDKAFGHGVLQLMQGIEQKGSMQKAASDMGLAYSKAWKMMKTAEKELGFALLERKSGGKNGGGSQITEKGKDMMVRFTNFENELKIQADQLYQKYFN